MSTATPEQDQVGGEPELRRVIGHKLRFLFIVGDILGTGVYALTGGLYSRSPANVEDWNLNLGAKCTEPPTKSNPRGTQNLPRVYPDLDGVPDANEPIIGSFDPETGKFRAGNAATTHDDSLAPSGNVAPPPLGEDSWKWLYLEPLLDSQE